MKPDDSNDWSQTNQSPPPSYQPHQPAPPVHPIQQAPLSFQPVQPAQPDPSRPLNVPTVTPLPEASPQQLPDETIINEEDAEYDGVLHWQGTEYVHHDNGARWYAVAGGILAILIVISIFLLDSYTFAALLVVMAVALYFYTIRAPRVLDYLLSDEGLYVNDQLHAYSEFKGFSIIDDGDEYSLLLIPVERFNIGVAVYFPEELGEDIVDTLGAHLPMHQLKYDLLGQILRKLRI